MRPGLRLWCLRHGESSNVVTGACGALPDAALTKVGRRQAAAAGAMLAAYTPAAVYASTARRAEQTAGIINRVLQLSQPPVLLDELVEVGLGSCEGATDPQTRAETARVLHAWVVLGDLRVRVADGESGHQVIDRMSAALREISDRHPGGTVVLVGHVASLTATLAALGGIGTRVWGSPLPHAVPFLVEHDDRRWRCREWPGTAKVVEPTGRPMSPQPN